MDDLEFRDKVVGFMGSIERYMEEHDRRMDAVEDDVHGNGDAGLKERVTTLEERSTKRDWTTTAMGSFLAAAAAIGTIFTRDKLG